MDYIQQINQYQLKLNGSEYSKTTTKSYASNYKILQNVIGEDLLENVGKYATTMKHINSIIIKDKPITDNRIRDLLNAYTTLMKANKIPLRIIKKYQTTIKELNDKQNELYKNNTLTSENQKTNIISLQDLDDYITLLKEKEQTVHLILSMMKFTPQRVNEYAFMKLSSKEEYDGFDTTSKSLFNYVVDNGDDTYTIYYRQYGTTKTRPKEIQPQSNEVSVLLKEYILLNTINLGDKLFNYEAPQLSTLMTRTSKKYIGRSISSQLIRKIIVSAKFNGSNTEQKSFAESIGHSVSTENAIYNKEL